MATESQIEANRLNAQKCTGPRTPEGKAISSQNAFKTGLCAESEIIPGESRESYEELAADFYRDYAPINAAERSLVDTMIRFEWLNRRYMSVSAAIWTRAFRDTKNESTGYIFNLMGDSILRADRAQNSAQRNFDKALARLTALQAKRPAVAVGPASAGQEPESPTEAQPPLNPYLVSFRTSPDQPSEANEAPPIAA